MLNEFWNYQRIVGSSMEVGKTSETTKHPIFKYILAIVYINLLSDITGFGQGAFIALGMNLMFICYIINAPNKVYETVPRSKLYFVVNIFSYVLISIISMYVVLHIITSLVGIFYEPMSVMLSFSNLWRSTTILLLTYILISCLCIPMFFIKKKITRKVILILGTFTVSFIIRYYHNTLLTIQEISILDKINLLPSYNEVLIILIALCIVFVPISIMASYRLYRGKSRIL